MINRAKLPSFLQDMPEERLKTLMETDDNLLSFDKVMDDILHYTPKKKKK